MFLKRDYRLQWIIMSYGCYLEKDLQKIKKLTRTFEH